MKIDGIILNDKENTTYFVGSILNFRGEYELVEILNAGRDGYRLTLSSMRHEDSRRILLIKEHSVESVITTEFTVEPE